MTGGTVIGFAHRGAPARGVRENTLAAFRAALGAGATGLESDVWQTADGVPVLEHDGALPRSPGRPCRRPLRTLPAADLPGWLPRLADLYGECGTGYDLSLDAKDPSAAGAVVRVAETAGAADRLWLCGHVEEVLRWPDLAGRVHLVASTTLRGVPLEPLAARLRAGGVEVLNLRAPEWTAARVDLAHRAGLLAFAWDVQTPALLARLLGWGVDAVYSDSVDLLGRVPAHRPAEEGRIER